MTRAKIPSVVVTAGLLSVQNKVSVDNFSLEESGLLSVISGYIYINKAFNWSDSSSISGDSLLSYPHISLANTSVTTISVGIFTFTSILLTIKEMVT